MLETKPGSRNTLIFLAGLSDTLAVVPYLPRLAEAVAPLDFSLVQPQLSSSLGGYGLSSLEADAQEVCLLIDYLHDRHIDPKPKDGKVVIMGHSTGTQDVVQILSQKRRGTVVDGGVLQAAISDREYFERENEKGSPGQVMLEHASSLVEKGQGTTLLERHMDVPPPRLPSSEENKVNGAAFQVPAMTAYRFWSLNAKGGDDDYFSSDLPDSRMAEIWEQSIRNGNRILAVLGEEE
jgi:pimeloyl-ACP methyl ester carboxylesterase